MAETCRVLAAAASKSRCSTSVPSLPPPFPKSPPEYPDLYGKRKEIVKVQMLDREIGFLEVGFNFSLNFFIAPSTCHMTAVKRRGKQSLNSLKNDSADLLICDWRLIISFKTKIF